MAQSTQGKTLYAILGVAHDADQAALDAAHQSLLRMLDDMLPGPDKTEHLATINHAYEQLSDPLRRHVYDARLAATPLAATGTTSGRNSQPTLPFEYVDAGERRMDAKKLRLYIRIAFLILLVLLPSSCYYMVAQSRQQEAKQREFAQAVQKEEQLLTPYLQDADDTQLLVMKAELERLQQKAPQSGSKKAQQAEARRQAKILLQEKAALLAKIRKQLQDSGTTLPPPAK